MEQFKEKNSALPDLTVVAIENEAFGWLSMTDSQPTCFLNLVLPKFPLVVTKSQFFKKKILRNTKKKKKIFINFLFFNLISFIW